MIFVNRYFPLNQYPYIIAMGRPSHATGDFFITTASNAADYRDRDIGIAELSGFFDQSQLASSFEDAHISFPGLSELVNSQLPWTMGGKLQSQGFAYSYQQYLCYGLSVGILGLAMRSNSSIDFFFDSSKASSSTIEFTQNNILMLDNTRRQMLATLGLSCNHVQQGGLGDTELYARWWKHYEYCFKLRSLDYGIKLGTIIPTGIKREINKPASVPFGMNGHWGLYVSGEIEAELKEDWKAGCWLRLIHEFPHTRIERMPADNEPQIFGVVTGPARIAPGFSQAFLLYTQWEGLRNGFGVRLQYTLVNHQKDHWTDERTDKTIPVKLDPVQERSSWASEYVTLNAFYNFNRGSMNECGNKPMVRAAWDIPFTLLVGHRFVHSYKISLGLEFNF